MNLLQPQNSVPPVPSPISSGSPLPTNGSGVNSSNDFQQMYNTDTDFKSLADTAKSQGLSAKDFQSIWQQKQQQKQQAQQSSNQPGFFHGMVQDIAHPFLKMTSSGTALLGSALDVGSDIAGKMGVPGATDFSNKLDTQLQQQNKEGTDYGWFGKVQPIQNPWDAMGTGANLASYVIPVGPEAKVAEELAAQGGKEMATQLSKGAAQEVAQTVTKGLGSRAWSFFKNALPFAATQTTGTALTDVGQGKTAGQTVSDSATTAIGSLAGILAFTGAGAILKGVAGDALKSDALQKTGLYVNKLISNTLNLGPEFDGKNIFNQTDFKMITNALKQQFESAKNKSVSSLSDMLKLPVDAQGLYDKWGVSMENSTAQMMKDTESKYSEAFSPAHTVSDLDPTRNSLNSAESYMNGQGGGLSAESQPARAQLMEALKNANSSKGSGINLGESSGVSSGFSKFVNSVRQAIGTADKPSALGLDQMRSLFLQSGSVGENQAEQDMAKEIGHNLWNDAHTEMRNSDIPIKQEAAAQMQGARNEMLNQRGIIGSWMTKLRNIGNPVQFLEEKVLKGAPKGIDMEALNSIPPSARSQLGDLMYETLRQKTTGNLSKAGDSVANGDIIDKVLKNWSNSGLFDSQHIANLKMLSNAMHGSFEDVVSHLQGLQNEGHDLSEEALSATTKDAQSAATKGAQSGQMDALSQAVGNKPLFTPNGDGTSDLTNLQQALTKANTNGEYTDILSVLNGHKDLTAVNASKTHAIIQTVIGSVLLAHHPIIGASQLIHGLSAILGKTANKVSAQDMTKLITGMLTDGTLEPKDLNNLITGKYDAFISAVTKGSALTGQQGVKQVSEIK